MERLSLEFKEENLKKEDLDLLDSYFEHKRWFKKKSKAILRDWEKERKLLKEKTINLIEKEVEETAS